MAKLLAIATFTAMLAVTTLASAEDPRFVVLREEVHDLDGRSKEIRRRAARSSGPDIRRESERIASIVERRCVSVSTRLDVLELLGDSEGDERGPMLDEMEATLESADRLLTMAEGWYGIR